MKYIHKNFLFNACVFGFATLISILRSEFIFALISSVFSLTFILITVIIKQNKNECSEIIEASEQVEACN